MPESDITELVRMWIAGWTVSRGSAEPVDRPWGWSIDVGAPAGEVARHVLPAPTEADVRKLAETITAPHTWLKLFAAGDSVRPWLGPQWRQDAAAFLMTVELTPERPTVPDGYTVTTWERGGVLRTLVRDEAGHQAARGQAGLAGPVAVPDQIVTSADHRRRGLGSVVSGRCSRPRTSGAHAPASSSAAPRGRRSTPRSAGPPTPRWRAWCSSRRTASAHRPHGPFGRLPGR